MAKPCDAWIVGLHDLPPDVPSAVVGSAVVVHDPETDEWTGMSLERFERDYEWLPEPPEPPIAGGGFGVF